MSRALNYREIHRRFELEGPRATVSHFREAVQQGHLEPEDFRIRELAEAVIPDGREWVRACDPVNLGSSLYESMDGVDVTAFANIVNELLSKKIMDAYQHEEFIFTRLIPPFKTKLLNGERIAGVQNLSDNSEEVKPGMPYPSYGFGEDYIDTPATKKYGFEVNVTKEAVFADLTGQVLLSAAGVGESLGLNKEKRLIDLAIGVTNNYKWRGTSYNTYQASAPWINVISGNDLADYTDLDAVDQLFANMLDPNTGEPILVNAKTVICCPARGQVLNRLVNAIEVRTGDGASGTVQTISGNPVSGYTGYVSKLMQRRIIDSGVTQDNAKAWWFVGDLTKAFAYMEVWPIAIEMQMSDSNASFERDIIARYKASERGAAAVLNPRCIVKSYNA